MAPELHPIQGFPESTQTVSVSLIDWYIHSLSLSAFRDEQYANFVQWCSPRSARRTLPFSKHRRARAPSNPLIFIPNSPPIKRSGTIRSVPTKGHSESRPSRRESNKQPKCRMESVRSSGCAGYTDREWN